MVEETLKASKWFVPAFVTIMLVTILVGFAYLQNEINDLRNPNSSSLTPIPTSTVTPEPQPTSTPESVTPPATTTTTTTYGGTTLVCAGSLSLGNNGGPILIINSLNITNIGTATAYNVNLRIQTYYPNGTIAADVIKKLDALGIYSPFPTPAYVPVNISPGQTIDPINGRPLSYEVYGIPPYDNILANYTITPVWSSTPVD